MNSLPKGYTIEVARVSENRYSWHAYYKKGFFTMRKKWLGGSMPNMTEAPSMEFAIQRAIDTCWDHLNKNK